MEREPAVAGAFYPDDSIRLSKLVDEYLKEAKLEGLDPDGAVSYVAPHAGYIYSGRTAAYTFKALSKRRDLGNATFVLIGPNHTGDGTALSISGADWMTPLGKASNDIELTKRIAGMSKFISIEERAHAREHSIEVELPFLQRVVKNPRCCFICMGDQGYEAAKMLCKAITDAAVELKRNIVIIASSDFNHYESAEVAKGKDMPAIGALRSLDTEKFNELIDRLGDTACGHGPITVAAMYAKANRARIGKLMKYATSGDANGDYDSVVAYASIIFAR
ncbi:MAG: AmmeMemoRadiSam system protein B [Candidatus Micrarchaeota archaeon]|nr:AmmeMemoRadiSam system protein B [Candidatus Micrarchaeota archaeon]